MDQLKNYYSSPSVKSRLKSPVLGQMKQEGFIFRTKDWKRRNSEKSLAVSQWRADNFIRAE
jgi:hypothetical protein